ncbi:MAG TPA: radical SAM family heme chaperone HemW [Chitinophagaceae bacterium]|nr:radical SAM family heme chaperone HemW [Chitinophagaceae bacterium]
MSGIYIHIPFCKQACHYCNFHFSTSLRYKNELIAALLKEIEIYSSFSNCLPIPGEQFLAAAEATIPHRIETIYIGGGTPSLCTKNEIQSIIRKIRSCLDVSPSSEITLEANPDDITAEKLNDWKEAGINRLSIGIQSFFEDDLQWMNRAHNASQAIDSLQLAIRSFKNITIDLIYGTPGLSNEKWKQNVEKAILLGIPHLSCYALTVEPKTPLDKLIRQHKSPDINPDKQSEQFLLLMQWLEEAGYEHYEISNFAKPGFRSRHNSSYWKGKNYIGFGPSAHSFDGNARWWNIANNNTYIDSINKGIIPYEKEVLTTTQRANEYIMISLRTNDGLDLSNLNETMGDKLLASCGKYIENGLVKLENNFLKLTRDGKLLADGIAADLFFD